MFFKSGHLLGVSVLVLTVVMTTTSFARVFDVQAVAWDRDVGLTALTAIDARLNAVEATATGEPLTLSGSRSSGLETRSVTTCAGYLEAISLGFSPRTTFDSMLEYVFVRDCYLLRDLKNARPSLLSFLPKLSFDLLNLVPPVLLWGPAEKKYDPSRGWSEVTEGLHGTELTADLLSAEDSTGTYTLQIVGRGDFNGDGIADWAVVGGIHATGGSYRESRYMILTRCQASGILRVLTASEGGFALTGSSCSAGIP